jgi:hypothetical protein
MIAAGVTGHSNFMIFRGSLGCAPCKGRQPFQIPDVNQCVSFNVILAIEGAGNKG